MDKKKKNIILLICVIVLFVAILILRNALTNNENKNKEYNTLNDFTTPKEVIEYMGGKYIKEKKSTDENFYLDIYADLKVNTYTNEVSNEEHYRQLVRIMANTLAFKNFRIIDEFKNILISVICNEEDSSISRTYINGDDNYFANQDSKINLEKMQDVKITKFKIEAPELIQLINNNWDKNIINTNGAEELDNYLYLDNGISIRNVYKQVFNIIFKNNYKNNILNEINTSTSMEEVIEILGEPTFGSIEGGLIGYKGNQIYAFFTGYEVSIYRVENDEENNLINILRNFNDSGDVKKFVSAITDMWKDYDLYEYDSNFVDLVYSLKGVKIQFNITSSHGLIVGNNYIGNLDELVNLKEELGIQEIYFDNTDFVYEAEISRRNNVKG